MNDEEELPMESKDRESKDFLPTRVKIGGRVIEVCNYFRRGYSFARRSIWITGGVPTTIGILQSKLEHLFQELPAYINPYSNAAGLAKTDISRICVDDDLVDTGNDRECYVWFISDTPPSRIFKDGIKAPYTMKLGTLIAIIVTILLVFSFLKKASSYVSSNLS